MNMQIQSGHGRGIAQAGVLPAHFPRAAARTSFGWHFLTLFGIIGVILIIQTMILNPAMQWDVVAQYFTLPAIIEGVGRTLLLTVVSQVLGIIIGVLAAMMRISNLKVLSWSAWVYVWFFRGTPLLVQIIFWYNLAALLPNINIGIPFTDIVFVGWDTNAILTPFVSAVLALSLNEGAYMSEIVRAGILSVDGGQGEAASALGMRRSKAMVRIILPQALRVIIPPTGNQTISMLKNTALVSVTSLPELLYSVQLIYSRTFETIPLLVVASIWYLGITTVLSIGQYYLERRFARGSTRNLPPTPIQKLRRTLSSIGKKGQPRSSGSGTARTETERIAIGMEGEK